MRRILAPSLLIGSALFFLTSCGGPMKHEETFNERMLEVQKARIKNGEDVYADRESELSADPVQSSLWAKSVGSPYIIRNQKASKVGDLITILIDESATATTEANTDTNRESTLELSAAASAGGGKVIPQLGSVTGDSSTKNEFKGKGSTDRSGKFQTTVQAVVESVLPNGTLYIRGQKVIAINHEDQEVEITGFVRPDDIRIDNTVISTLMADAEIRYSGRGVVGDKQRVGWASRLFDWVWPF